MCVVMMMVVVVLTKTSNHQFLRRGTHLTQHSPSQANKAPAGRGQQRIKP